MKLLRLMSRLFHLKTLANVNVNSASTRQSRIIVIINKLAISLSRSQANSLNNVTVDTVLVSKTQLSSYYLLFFVSGSHSHDRPTFKRKQETVDNRTQAFLGGGT